TIHVRSAGSSAFLVWMTRGAAGSLDGGCMRAGAGPAVDDEALLMDTPLRCPAAARVGSDPVSDAGSSPLQHLGHHDQSIGSPLHVAYHPARRERQRRLDGREDRRLAPLHDEPRYVYPRRATT